MKHTIEDLLAIVYRYYPHGIASPGELRDPRRKETEEYARLVAARKKAATDERWRALQLRVMERFPRLMPHSLHLPTGHYDACYSFTLDLRGFTRHQTLWFHVSFLAAYYIIYEWRLIGGIGGEQAITFDLSPESRACAEWVARDIEATFGCEPMPPEVGSVPVPDVETNLRCLGAATIYDCLFAEAEWPWGVKDPAQIWEESQGITRHPKIDRPRGADWELRIGLPDGHQCLGHVRALRHDPPVANAAELDDWDRALRRMRRSLQAMAAGEIEPELPVSDDLLRSIEDVRVHLSGIVPGAQLGERLFDLVDAAWAELQKTKERR